MNSSVVREMNSCRTVLYQLSVCLSVYGKKNCTIDLDTVIVTTICCDTICVINFGCKS